MKVVGRLCGRLSGFLLESYKALEAREVFKDADFFVWQGFGCEVEEFINVSWVGLKDAKAFLGKVGWELFKQFLVKLKAGGSGVEC